MRFESRGAGECLELHLASEWIAAPALRGYARWALERGYLTEQAGSSLLSVPWADWDEWEHGPLSTDPEDEDLWASDHEAIASLLGITREDIRVAAVGHVGGSGLRLRVLANATELDAASRRARWLYTNGSETVKLSPLGASIARQVADFSSSAPHSRAEQLALLGRLNGLRALVARFPSVQRRLSLTLDAHLASFEVEQPSAFAPKWVADGNRVTLQMFVKGEDEPLPLADFDEAAGVVDLPGRKSVLLSPGAHAIATRAREHQRVRREKVPASILRSPLELVPEGTDTGDLDFSEYALDDFSHRVVGFEPAKRDVAPTYSSGMPWYDRDGDGKPRFFISAQTPSGGTVQLALGSAQEALIVATQAEQAAGMQPSVPIQVQEHQVLPSAELGQQLRSLVRLAGPAEEPAEQAEAAEASAPAKAQQRLRAVLEEVAELPVAARGPAGDIEAQVPWSELEALFAPGVKLKAHQRSGIAWLWYRYTTGLPGALLADDMGLGKTLQIASFMALAKALPRRDVGIRPTLIVAPVVLIANWAEELTKFFVSSSFPGKVLKLQDDALRARKTSQGGLDRDALRDYDIVITSYESLAKYQLSLLAINWDLVILDEAHRIKNRGTGWSVAARGLSGLDDPQRPRKFEFGICSTGTPVENHVHDLWSPYDFLSPGSPFGTFEEFTRDYGTREDAPRALALRLQVGSMESSLLRRTKQGVLSHELPAKTYRSILVEMTAFQAQQERVISSRKHKKGGFFTVLQSLQKLYQHPWLLEDEDRRGSLDEALALSPKLALTLQLLTDIKARGEKALVFTLWTNMQHLLRDVIEAKLGLEKVRIINGDPKNRTRALEFIREFTEKPGFDVMVLSPLAAGVGLNITAANHVIHYGRWWNPAKEDQATDRAYRIGQTRPVTVYYPVLHHPGQPDSGFDVKLDLLVTNKRNMARELLEPVDGDDVGEDDLRSLGVEEQ